MIDPIRLADLLGPFVGLLVFKAASTVEEPQEKTRFRASVGREYWKIVIRNTDVFAEHHLRGSCVPIQSLTTEYVSSGNVEVAVVIAVRRCPWQISLNQGSDYLINVSRTILEERVLSSDQIAIKDLEHVPISVSAPQFVGQ